MISQDIEKNSLREKVETDNNIYEQKFNLGNKITYGAPFQLKHIFSDKYLTLNLNEMSQEFGCCETYLSDTQKESWFIIEPCIKANNQDGYVVNYSDYFHIRSLEASTPFYYHIFKKPSDFHIEQDEKNYVDRSYKLNASQEPSKLKAKLFMSYNESEKEKEYI